MRPTVIAIAFLLLVQACNFGTTDVGEPVKTAESEKAATQTAASHAAAKTLEAAAPTETAILETSTPAATSTMVPVTYPAGPTGFPADVNPLTGLRVLNPEILNRRPLAVKVPNYPRTARPQAGLSAADMLIEFYTEAGSTRFIAMYYGQEAEKVGPIRSARIMDTRILPHYDAIIVHVQAFEAVWDVISETGVSTINEFPASCPVICRDAAEADGVNSAFGNTIELTKYAKRVGMDNGRPNLEGLLFDPAPPADAKDSIGLWIRFSSSAFAEWKWDPESSRYLRFSEKDNTGAMIPLTDRITGGQLAIDNLVVMFTPIVPYYTEKFRTGELWDVYLTGPGRAVLFRDGKVIDGQWQNTGPAAPFRFVDKTGQQIALHPGTTYIAIVGAGTQTGASGSEWQFYNRW
jgi:hypothetical protein